MDTTTLMALLARCAPLVHAGTAQALIAVESGFNPHAIGVVAGALERQPRTLAEAIATAESLQRDGWNFSVGLAQINRHNFARLGLTSTSAFEPCANLHAMQVVLTDCFDRMRRPEPQTAVRQALSCYYSGNPTTGFVHGYVRRVVRAMPSVPSSPVVQASFQTPPVTGAGVSTSPASPAPSAPSPRP